MGLFSKASQAWNYSKSKAQQGWNSYQNSNNTPQSNDNNAPRRSFGESINSKGTIIFLILVTIVGFIYWIYSKGKKEGISAKGDIPIIPYLDDGSVTNDWKQTKGDPYANSVFRLTQGIDVLFGRKQIKAKADLYTNMLRLTKSQLTYVYSRFNDSYYGKNSETMTQAIEDDVHWWLDSPENEPELIAKLKQYDLS